MSSTTDVSLECLSGPSWDREISPCISVSDCFSWDAQIDPIWPGLFLLPISKEKDVFLMAGLSELPADTAS